MQLQSKTLRFRALDSDPSIYYSPTHDVILAVYFDVILIFDPHKEACDEVFNLLQKQFKMHDLGYPKTSLGLNIIRHENGSNSINQNGYIDRILARF